MCPTRRAKPKAWVRIGQVGGLKIDEEELEMAWAWVHDWDLLIGTKGKDLTLEHTVHRFWALSQCQFGKVIEETKWWVFFYCLLPCKAMLSVV